MSGLGRTLPCLLAIPSLVAGGPRPRPAAAPLPSYQKALMVGPRAEWRFHPLVVDLNKDRHVDLVATARRAKDALHIWLGDGKEDFTELQPTWSDTGYAALA